MGPRSLVQPLTPAPSVLHSFAPLLCDFVPRTNPFGLLNWTQGCGRPAKVFLLRPPQRKHVVQALETRLVSLGSCLSILRLPTVQHAISVACSRWRALDNMSDPDISSLTLFAFLRLMCMDDELLNGLARCALMMRCCNQPSWECPCLGTTKLKICSRLA